MTNTSRAVIIGLCLAPLATPSAPQTGTPAPKREQILGAATDLMRAARYCTFVTVDEEGQPRARVVDPFPPDADMTVWMATKAASRKVAQIRDEGLAGKREVLQRLEELLGVLQDGPALVGGVAQ